MASDTGCKLDRVVERWGLDDVDQTRGSIDEVLLARWTGEGDFDAMGYRSLTDWFNERLLRRAFDEHGRDTLGGRVEHDYEALVGDDDLLRREVEESLEADGIDARRLREDFISWGTMRTHLQECLDGEKPRGPSDRDWERESVEMATTFAREKVESAVSSLGSKGQLEGVASSSVSIRVQLRCDHCPTTVPFEVALEQGYVCETHARGADSHHHDAEHRGENA